MCVEARRRSISDPAGTTRKQRYPGRRTFTFRRLRLEFIVVARVQAILNPLSGDSCLLSYCCMCG